MTLIRSLFAAGLFLGVATAAPAASNGLTNADTKFDVVSWLNRAIFNEERQLVVKQALQSWLLNNPAAAKEADSELAEFIKHQDDLRMSIDEQKNLNLTELLQKNIELEQLDLSARRLYLSNLNTELQADPAIIDKRARARISEPRDDEGSLRALLAQGIKDETEALETRQRAAQYLLDHPEEAARADKVREQVMERLAAEGDEASMLGKHAQDVGLAQALNHSVIFRAKVIKAMKHALEILENDPEQAAEASYQISQMIENPALAQHIATSEATDFETLQFAGSSLMPFLSQIAARQGLMQMRSRTPFGQYAGGSASSDAAPGRLLGSNAGSLASSPFVMYL